MAQPWHRYVKNCTSIKSECPPSVLRELRRKFQIRLLFRLASSDSDRSPRLYKMATISLTTSPHAATYKFITNKKPDTFANKLSILYDIDFSKTKSVRIAFEAHQAPFDDVTTKVFFTGTHFPYEIRPAVSSPLPRSRDPKSRWLKGAVYECLEMLCVHLASHIQQRELAICLDFALPSCSNALRLLECVKPLAPLRQFCFSASPSGCFAVPNGCWDQCDWFDPTKQGQFIIHKMKKQISTDICPPFATKSTEKSLFTNSPPEVQSMILSHLVVEESLVPLKNTRLNARLPAHRHRSRRCCGHCRGRNFSVQHDGECRCTSSLSYSTSCRCISLSDGIFFVSKNIRNEALKLYWANNTILLHGWVCGQDQACSLWEENISRDLYSIPRDLFKKNPSIGHRHLGFSRCPIGSTNLTS